MYRNTRKKENELIYFFHLFLYKKFSLRVLNNLLIYIYIYVYIYIYIYIYIHLVFTTDRSFEVAIESWLEWDLNPGPLNFVQTL